MDRGSINYHGALADASFGASILARKEERAGDALVNGLEGERHRRLL